jgi:hypothetical protein
MIWIVKIVKKNSLLLDFGFSNATFVPPDHAFTLQLKKKLKVLNDS